MIADRCRWGIGFVVAALLWGGVHPALAEDDVLPGTQKLELNEPLDVAMTLLPMMSRPAATMGVSATRAWTPRRGRRGLRPCGTAVRAAPAPEAQQSRAFAADQRGGG